MLTVYNDGGRAAAGYTGKNAGDCVCRAVAIITELPYHEIYGALNCWARIERPRKAKVRSSARTGIKRATADEVKAGASVIVMGFLP